MQSLVFRLIHRILVDFFRWLNSWTRGNLMASSLDIFRDADYSVCRILTIGSFRRELFGWLEHMENLVRLCSNYAFQ
ncbi:unnamed protein product [Rhizophagus irregularis]|nr:unnamed protein product [Rhizophagus irregularis]